jgi:hypothetical protein
MSLAVSAVAVDRVDSPASPASQLAGPVSAPASQSFGRRLFRRCASLQLAIPLLGLFTFCLAVATFVEAWYGTRMAQQLIYRSWWFAGLLLVLSVNVLCAALKKYPWKRHQTGFLITHAGLLVLIFGGLLTVLGGTDGQMVLIDSENREIQEEVHIANKADTIQLADQHRVEVFRVPAKPAADDPVVAALSQAIDGGQEPVGELDRALRGHYWSFDLSPGSLPWFDDEYFRADLPIGLRFLQTLADPFPGMAHDLDGSASVTIHNFYPHTEQWPMSKAEPGSPSFAAVRVRLTSSMIGRPMERWITSVPDRERDPMPLALEMMVLPDVALLPEFVDPPATKDLGTLGRLVLLVGKEKTRCAIDLDKVKPGETIPLAGTDVTFTLAKTGPLMELLAPDGDKHKPPQANAPTFPAVLFELARPGARGTYVACARLPNLPVFLNGEPVALLSVWHHHPDFRWGDASKFGAIQLLQTPDEKVYYRVFGKDGLRDRGQELDTSDGAAAVQLPLKPMDMSLHVTAYLPKAVKHSCVIPRHLRPGADNPPGMAPALRCTLSSGRDNTEFWVRLSRQPTRVQVGETMYIVRYRNASREADFALTLKRASQTTDPGTNRPATFQSDVIVTDKGKGRSGGEHSITMNNPLSFGPYKVYQSNYTPLTNPQTMDLLVDDDRVVSLSGLTVAHDPGLWCKYIGSGLLVLGIATMFYMRAYFFKRREAMA